MAAWVELVQRGCARLKDEPFQSPNTLSIFLVAFAVRAALIPLIADPEHLSRGEIHRVAVSLALGEALSRVQV